MMWEKRTELRFRDFDYLGHMTATSYLALVEEARVEWLSQATNGELPAYVVATQKLDFHREILPVDGPIRIIIGAQLISPRKVSVSEKLVGVQGHLHASSHAVLVAWDVAGRCSRPFTEAERVLFCDHPGGDGSAKSQETIKSA
jgi:acyl-CoA thioesterase FadM